MPSLASSSILRMAQLYTPVRCQSQVSSWASCFGFNRSLSWRWITSHLLLLLDVLLDDGQWGTTHGRHKIAVRPERGQPRAEPGEFLPQEPRGAAFDEPDEPMNTVLRVNL